MNGNKKLQVWLPLIFALILIAGMYIGYELQDPYKPGKSGPLQEAIDLIKLKYVDPVHLDSLESN
ncbi:MAG: carboxyl-terminal protease, partial [Bacteroidota bacterium]